MEYICIPLNTQTFNKIVYNKSDLPLNSIDTIELNYCFLQLRKSSLKSSFYTITSLLFLLVSLEMFSSIFACYQQIFSDHFFDLFFDNSNILSLLSSEQRIKFDGLEK